MAKTVQKVLPKPEDVIIDDREFCLALSKHRDSVGLMPGLFSAQMRAQFMILHRYRPQECPHFLRQCLKEMPKR